MTGRFVIIHLDGERMVFVECPECHHLTHVPGKPRFDKAEFCYGCSQHFIAPHTLEGAREYDTEQV